MDTVTRGGIEQRIHRDGLDRVSRTVRLEDGQQAEEVVTAWASGRLARVRSTAVREGTGQSVLQSEILGYDGLGRPLQVVDGTTSMTLTHPTAGNLVSGVTPNGGVQRTTTYAPSGRVARSEALAASGPSRSVTPSYVNDSFTTQSVSIQDPGTHQRDESYGFDRFGRLNSVRSGGREVASMIRRPDGAPEEITRGAVRLATPHDREGRSLGRVKDSGLTNERRYDGQGRSIFHGTRAASNAAEGRTFGYDFSGGGSRISRRRPTNTTPSTAPWSEPTATAPLRCRTTSNTSMTSIPRWSSTTAPRTSPVCNTTWPSPKTSLA